MQTVTFPCDHCGRRLRADLASLGQSVRCPLCQGVVAARLGPAADELSLADGADNLPPLAAPLAAEDQPAPAEPGPPPPLPDLVEPVAIAGDLPSESSSQSDLPVVRIVTDEPVNPVDGTAEPVQLPPSPSADPLLAAAEESPVAALIAATPADFTPTDPPPAERHWPGESADPPAFQTPASAPDVSLSRERARAPAPAGVSIWFVIPLVSYSVLATVLLVMLWNRPSEVHPLIAFLPDAEGDAPGVIRKPKGVNEARKRKLISEPLPEELKLKLGETRTVGALAVTPLRVTRETVGVSPGGAAAPAPQGGPSLVLYLRVENVSTDEAFQPLDRFFDRKWREVRPVGPPPLTLLDAGPRLRFFGGPAEWRPKPRPERNNDAGPEFIYLMGGDKPAQAPIDRALGPGETADVFVCTDGDDPRAGELVRHRGAFVWRVHLRRGLVPVRGQDVPAAAVVGVTFTDRDIGG